MTTVFHGSENTFDSIQCRSKFGDTKKYSLFVSCNFKYAEIYSIGVKEGSENFHDSFNGEYFLVPTGIHFKNQGTVYQYEIPDWLNSSNTSQYNQGMEIVIFEENLKYLCLKEKIVTNSINKLRDRTIVVSPALLEKNSLGLFYFGNKQSLSLEWDCKGNEVSNLRNIIACGIIARAQKPVTSFEVTALIQRLLHTGRLSDVWSANLSDDRVITPMLLRNCVSMITSRTHNEQMMYITEAGVKRIIASGLETACRIDILENQEEFYHAVIQANKFGEANKNP